MRKLDQQQANDSIIRSEQLRSTYMAVLWEITIFSFRGNSFHSVLLKIGIVSSEKQIDYSQFWGATRRRTKLTLLTESAREDVNCEESNRHDRGDVRPRKGLQRGGRQRGNASYSNILLLARHL